MDILILIAIAALIGIIFYQMALLRKSRREHDEKMEVLQRIIVQLAESTKTGREKVRLSNDLLQQLKSANITLSHEINEMVRDFVETLSVNNLIK